jgi:P-type Cu+ transporter
MKLASLVMAVAVLALAVAAGCQKSPSSAVDPAGITQKFCPVMVDPINPNIFVVYKGRTIYFCCPECPPKFNADPEKYLKILDGEMKGGTVKPPAAPAEKIAYWTCTMHPDVRSDKPGKCPKCSMAMVPVPEKPAATPSAPTK